MENVFLDLFNMSINAGWLVLAILLFRLIFKKAPKSLRVVMWGLVGLRLICPFSFESVLSLIPSAEAVPPEMVYSNSSADVSGAEIFNAIGNNQVSFDLGIQDGNVVFNEYTAPDGDFINPLLIITYIASIVWVVGMAVMLLYTLISYLRILKNVREATPLKENIWLCDNISTPFILGIFKPCIFLPSSMSEQDMEFVVAHEKAHLKRRDHWWKPLGFALLTVYWFNPVLWVAYVLLCRDIELACDEKVIKEMGAEIKKPYSEALINCSAPRKMISACPLAFGETGVKGRIKSVLNYKKPAFWVIIVAVIAIIVTAICFMTNPQSYDGPGATKADYLKNKYGITNVSSGTEVEGVTIDLSSAVSLTGYSRYIEIEWNNQTDKLISFGEECHIFKKVGSKWVECEIAENFAWNMLAYSLNDHSTRTHQYGHYSHEEFTSGEYRFETEFSIESELPRQDYKAWLEFEYESGVTYEYACKTDEDSAYITLTPATQEFSFTFSMFSSYWPRGTYEEDGEYIVMKTDDGKNKYTFKKESGSLVFVADKSSPMPEYRYSQDATPEVCLPDGAVFTQYIDNAPYTVSFANYSGEFIGGLNADKMYISHTKHLPIFKFDNVEELNNFKSRYGETLTMDKGMDEIPSFNSVTEDYDNTFFEDKSLLLVYVPSGSMSWRYGVESISVNNTSLLVKVERTDNNETGNCAMSGWFITIAMDKEELENYTEFDAIMLEE